MQLTPVMFIIVCPLLFLAGLAMAGKKKNMAEKAEAFIK